MGTRSGKPLGLSQQASRWPHRTFRFCVLSFSLASSQGESLFLILLLMGSLNVQFTRGRSLAALSMCTLGRRNRSCSSCVYYTFNLRLCSVSSDIGFLFSSEWNMWEHCVHPGFDRIGTVLDGEGAVMVTFCQFCARYPSKISISCTFSTIRSCEVPTPWLRRALLPRLEKDTSCCL